MTNKPKILLAEDEPSLGKIIKESLETRNFIVTHCLDGEEALKEYHTEKPDLLVLDVMMPKKDGFTLAKEIRKTNATIPIIFLTAKSQTEDVIKGFKSGGNDYIRKPFSMEELIIRMLSLLKNNTSNTKENTIYIGKYFFNAQKQTLLLNGKTTNLTARETALLNELLLAKNENVNRNYLLNKLWGNDDFFSGRSLDVFITKLRKKLKDDANVKIINIRGFGYKLIF